MIGGLPSRVRCTLGQIFILVYTHSNEPSSRNFLRQKTLSPVSSCRAHNSPARSLNSRTPSNPIEGLYTWTNKGSLDLLTARRNCRHLVNERRPTKLTGANIDSNRDRPRPMPNRP